MGALPPIGQPQVGAGWVSVTDGLPGWTAYVGTEIQSQVLYDVDLPPLSFVGVWSNDRHIPPLSGRYAANLFPYFRSNLDVSIAQTGQIPAWVRIPTQFGQ